MGTFSEDIQKVKDLSEKIGASNEMQRLVTLLLEHKQFEAVKIIVEHRETK